MVQMNDENMVTASSLELFKQVTAKQLQELTVWAESQRQGKLEQSGYDLDLGHEKEMLSRQFAEEMERYHAQTADIVH